jgi:hypothetical protein
VKSAVVTLFEGDYVLGVGALVNSLARNGFTGKVYAGYRGALSRWAGSAADSYIAGPIEVHFFEVGGDLHLTNLKPTVMLDIANRLAPDLDALFYFDPDIVVTCRWSFFEEWAQCGLAIVQEITMAPMPDDHPIRCYWREWASEHGWPTVRSVDAPFNGGFIGVARFHFRALEAWRDIISAIGDSVDLSGFAPGERSHPFHMTDQDALNILSMIYPGALSRIGPEGMGFVPGGFTMLHAVGGVKPWRKRFVRSALAGIPPTLADKGWFANSSTPIPVLGTSERNRIGAAMKVGSALGRFVRRA